MCDTNSTAKRTSRSPQRDPPDKPLDRLLILEPEDLVRWSLATYLAKWFDICTAESQNTAFEILDRVGIDALVVSDDLSGRSTDRVVARARELNPRIRIVRTVSGPPSGELAAHPTPCIEKPFQLARLATLLMS